VNRVTDAERLPDVSPDKRGNRTSGIPVRHSSGNATNRELARRCQYEFSMIRQFSRKAVLKRRLYVSYTSRLARHSSNDDVIGIHTHEEQSILINNVDGEIERTCRSGLYIDAEGVGLRPVTVEN
jgi:hypothetical protein